MSLKADAERPPPGLLSELGFLRGKQRVGKWETCFWFSTFPRGVGAVGMWESRSDFQGLWARWKTCFWFSTASTDRHFHGPPITRSVLPWIRNQQTNAAWLAASAALLADRCTSALSGPELRASLRLSRIAPHRAVAAESATAWHTSDTPAAVFPSPRLRSREPRTAGESSDRG